MLLALLASILIPLPAKADNVELVNGDRLTGRIASMTDNELVLRTDYAGELRIQRKMVRSLRTDDTVTVLRADTGDLVQAVLEPLEDGRLGLQSEDGKEWSEVRLADVAYLNPTPDQTGRGVLYSGRALVSSTAARGNTNTDRLYSDGEFNARKKFSRYRLSGRVERRQEQGREVASSGLTDANYDRFLDGQKYFRYVRGSLERDRFKDLHLRSSLGAGYGWQLVETEETFLSVRLGPDYVVVNRIVGPDESYPALGWGVQYSHWLWARRLQAFHDSIGLWNLKDTGAISLRSKSGLRIPIASGLTASAQLNFDWERKPTGGRKPSDLTWLLGLGYDW
jgi:putative salt-induced outer membrane protein YdiY